MYTRCGVLVLKASGVACVHGCSRDRRVACSGCSSHILQPRNQNTFILNFTYCFYYDVAIFGD